ncbi:MAG: squalene/phytoene synthase family protein [Cyanophyceae cyanobacterium]
MNSLLVASLVGSSHYAAVRDDSLKDEDNAAWVMELPDGERREWVERIRWIRLVDRLAEKGQISAIAPEGVYTEASFNGASEETTDAALFPSNFSEFYQSWQRLRTVQPGKATDFIAHDLPHQSLEAPLSSILEGIAQRWFQISQKEMDRLSIQSWDSYVSAIAFYHGRHTEIQTLTDYETMMDGLAGSFFQILPYLEPHHWDCARHFGIVDQFYNNLRDLHEDLQQGICYFPAELLDRFGVTRESVVDGSCIGTENYRQLMEFWVGDYLLTLRRRAHGLLLCSDLHPSWLRLRAWCLRRYERIEQVMRQCKFDFVKFSQCYWQAVREDLHHYRQLGHGTSPQEITDYFPERLPQCPPRTVPTPHRVPQSPSPAASLALARVSAQDPITWCWAIAHFLKISPAAVVLAQDLFVCLDRFHCGDRPRSQISTSAIIASSISIPKGGSGEKISQKGSEVGINVPIIVVKGSSPLPAMEENDRPSSDVEDKIRNNPEGKRRIQTGSGKALQLLRVLRSQRFPKDGAAYSGMMKRWKSSLGNHQQWAFRIAQKQEDQGTERSSEILSLPL